MTWRDAGPSVEEVPPKPSPPEKPRVSSYRLVLDVPRELILFVSAVLAARRCSIGTRVLQNRRSTMPTRYTGMQTLSSMSTDQAGGFG